MGEVKPCKPGLASCKAPLFNVSLVWSQVTKTFYININSLYQRFFSICQYRVHRHQNTVSIEYFRTHSPSPYPNCIIMKIILSINAGSSSVKISVYSVEDGQAPKELAETQIDGLTAPPPKLKYTRGGKSIAKNQEVKEKIESQDEAFKFLLDQLVDDKELKEISSKGDITHTCHRVVHGGDYKQPKIINDDTYHHLEALTDLAPLHNASALEIVKSCMKVLPKARNIAYFDSQFHQTIPKHIFTYPINQEIAQKNKLRKYGFHGISYAFITRSVADFLGKPESKTSIIALHLGSGASACAIRGGKSWDTSMGLTPLAGLPGATRSGSVDPRFVSLIHVASHRKERILNHASVLFFITPQMLESSPLPQPKTYTSPKRNRSSTRKQVGSH